MSTGIAIPPQYWDKRQGYVLKTLPLSNGTAEHLNLELRRIYRIAEDLVVFIKQRKLPNPGQFAKNTFNPSLTTEDLEKCSIELKTQDVYSNRDIFFQIDNYVKSKANKVTPVVLRTYRNMQTYLLAFQEYRKNLTANKDYRIKFEDLDFNFYEEFVDFLTYHWKHVRRMEPIVGLKVNTVGRVIKDFEGFINDRLKPSKPTIPSDFLSILSAKPFFHL